MYFEELQMKCNIFVMSLLANNIEDLSNDTIVHDLYLTRRDMRRVILPILCQKIDGIAETL